MRRRRAAALAALIAAPWSGCGRASEPAARPERPAAATAPGAGAVPPAAPKAAGKPNIILIIGDDHGYPHYGFMGHPQIKTPHMDALVRGGTLFPFCHNSSPICNTSLETILSGRYPKDFALRGGRHEGVLTIPFALRPAGYATYGVGKFWSGFPQRGFEEYIPTSNMMIGRRTMQPIYDFADEWNGKKPFFVWYGPRIPHVPYNAPERFRAPYAGLGLDHDTLGYFANCSWVDDTVGELVAFLEKRKIRDRTLLLYVSDNGSFLPHSKGNFSDNGYRTVLWANLPGVVRSGRRLEGKLAHTIDVLPTIMDYAGSPVPRDREMEGRSLKPLLEGLDVPWRAYLFGQSNRASGYRFPANSRYAVSVDRMKLYTERNELYDLAKDPDETRNLIRDPAYAGRIAEMRAAVEGWARRDPSAAPETEGPPAADPDGEESRALEREWDLRLVRFDRDLSARAAGAPSADERSRIESFRDLAMETFGCAVVDPGEMGTLIEEAARDNGIDPGGLPRP